MQWMLSVCLRPKEETATYVGKNWKYSTIKRHFLKTIGQSFKTKIDHSKVCDKNSNLAKAFLSSRLTHTLKGSKTTIKVLLARHNEAIHSDPTALLLYDLGLKRFMPFIKEVLWWEGCGLCSTKDPPQRHHWRPERWTLLLRSWVSWCRRLLSRF